MERQYVGIDLHRRRSVIVRMTPEGEKLDVVRIENDPVAMALELAKAGPDPEVILEATYGWYWASDLLQLGPIAHQLPELPQLRRGDPGLGQPPEAQQVHQVGGVALVVLDPPVAPVVAQGMGQVHGGAVGLETAHCVLTPTKEKNLAQ